MFRFHSCTSCGVKRMSTTSRMSVLYIIGLILLLPLLTHTAHAQTTYDEPYGLIELSDVPTPAQRTALSDAGITLLDYLYDSTWTALFDTPVDPSQIEQIVSVKELEPTAKLSPDFSAMSEAITSNSTDGQIEVRIQSWNDDTNDYLEQYGTIVTQDWMFTVLRINENVLESLVNDPNTRWVEPVFPFEFETDPVMETIIIANAPVESNQSAATSKS